MAQFGWIIDISRCTGCNTCVVACQSENNTLELQTGKADLAYRQVIPVVKGSFPNLVKFWVTMACNHCLEPACMASCPVDAIFKRKEDGIVLIDQDKCIGCGYCQPACPYGAPRYNPNTGKYEKCTFCFHRVSQGFDPACVTTCLGRAIQYVREGGDFTDHGDVPETFADPELTRPAIKFIHRR